MCTRNLNNNDNNWQSIANALNCCCVIASVWVWEFSNSLRLYDGMR